MQEGRAFQNIEPPFRGSSSSGPALALVGFIGLCLLVAASDAAITQSSVHGWYLSLARPPLTPPNWLFGPVWSVLYLAIAVAAWLVWRQEGHRRALQLWGWQLLANALWTPAFFGLHSPGLGLVVMAVLLVLVALTARAFRPLSRNAALLMLPYGAWTLFAAWLNLGFWWLNT